MPTRSPRCEIFTPLPTSRRERDTSLRLNPAPQVAAQAPTHTHTSPAPQVAAHTPTHTHSAPHRKWQHIPLHTHSSPAPQVAARPPPMGRACGLPGATAGRPACGVSPRCAAHSPPNHHAGHDGQRGLNAASSIPAAHPLGEAGRRLGLGMG